MDRRTNSLFHIAFPILLFGVPFILLARRFWFVCDDAFITLRYGRNWALGHGLRYNLGDHSPVEGYSTFLWVVLCALLESLGLDPAVWAPTVSLVCGLVLLWLIYRVLWQVFDVSQFVALVSVLGLAFFLAAAGPAVNAKQTATRSAPRRRCRWVTT